MEPTLILEVVLMFLVRIGLPLLVLITLGVIVERWQAGRNQYINPSDEVIGDEPIRETI